MFGLDALTQSFFFGGERKELWTCDVIGVLHDEELPSLKLTASLP